MASKLDTEENNKLLNSNNFMNVREALDIGLTEKQISKIIKIAKGEKLTKREQDIALEAYKKLMKIQERMKSLGLDPSIKSSKDGRQSVEARAFADSPFPDDRTLVESSESLFQPLALDIDIDEDDDDDDDDHVDITGGKRKKRKTKRKKRKTKKRKGGKYLACICKKKRKSTGGKKRRKRKTRRRKK
tara:strand:- start:91 stop:654 length:564 start_codon:yes stop_codon:yes gene_type:complete